MPASSAPQMSASQIQALADQLGSDPKLQAEVNAFFGIKSLDTENPVPETITAPQVQTTVQTTRPADLNAGTLKPETTTKTNADAIKAVRPDTASDMLMLVKDHILPRRIKFSDNAYTPNASGLFAILHEMDTAIVRNFQARRTCLSLNPVVNQIYFAFLFSLQTARCMSYDQRLDEDDDVTLKSFLDSFPAEHLAIPGPLLPFYKAITTYKVQNAIHKRVCPVFPENTISKDDTAATSTITHNYCAMAFPNVPLTISVLSELYGKFETYDQSKSIDENLGFKDKVNPRSAFPFTYADKDDHSKGYTPKDIAGHKFTANTNAAPWSQNIAQSIANPALRYWPALTPDLLMNIKNYGCDVSFPSVPADSSEFNLKYWLCISKKKWFRPLIGQMADYSQLWTGSGTLADCAIDGPATGSYVYNYIASEDAPATPKAAFDPKSHFDLNGQTFTTQGSPEPITELLSVLTHIHCRPPPDHPARTAYSAAHRRFGTVWTNGPIYGPSNVNYTYDSLSETIKRFINPALLKLAK